jgi:hypothetical protein
MMQGDGVAAADHSKGWVPDIATSAANLAVVVRSLCVCMLVQAGGRRSTQQQHKSKQQQQQQQQQQQWQQQQQRLSASLPACFW